MAAAPKWQLGTLAETPGGCLFQKRFCVQDAAHEKQQAHEGSGYRHGATCWA